MTLCIPPLDVGHIIVRGTVQNDLTTEQLIERLAAWGSAFIVMHPDEQQERPFLALTLDRPQFVDTRSNLPKKCENLKLQWTGPCKVRFYINMRTKECFISFIGYPQIVGHVDAWGGILRSKKVVRTLSRPTAQPASQINNNDYDDCISALQEEYVAICTDLAIKMAEEFVDSGAAEEAGISVLNTAEAVDLSQLIATFGPSRGKEVEKQIRGILSKTRKRLFGREAGEAESPPSLVIFEKAGTDTRSQNIVECRETLLKFVKQKDDPAGDDEPRTYEVLCRALSEFSESTIGRVLDYELDWGTVKPSFKVETDGANAVIVSRIFSRGEYGSWSAEEVNPMLTYEDDTILKTIVIGAYVLDQFLRRMEWQNIGAAHLAKLFVNLQYDWRGQLYYFLQPYKYGPLPYVPQTQPLNQNLRFEQLLLKFGVLKETAKVGGSRSNTYYVPGDGEARLPWQKLYNQKTDGITKANIDELVRLYSKIQKDCKTTRPTKAHGHGPRLSVFGDPLIVLGTARNRTVTYTSGWFELDDWRAKGRLLMNHILGLLGMAEQGPADGLLTNELSDWAEPAALLFDKIEMYRYLPFLRKQLEEFRGSGDYGITHVVLESVDVEPLFETDSDYPIENLVWACHVIKAFSSFTRQVLTACRLDLDKRSPANRVDRQGAAKNAMYYLQALITAEPDLAVLETELRSCAEKAEEGILIPQVAETLNRAFKFIVNLFKKANRIPTPSLLHIDIANSEKRADLIARFREISINSAHAIAVSDIYNFIGIVKHYGDGSGSSFDSVEIVRRKVEACAKEAAEAVQTNSGGGVRFYGISGDSFVFAGEDPNQVLRVIIDFTKRTTQAIGQRIENVPTQAVLRSWIGWCDRNMSEGFQGIYPGTTAYKIGDKHGRRPGAIAVPQAVFERLSHDNQNLFEKAKDDKGEIESSDQGDVYLRHWNYERDALT